MDWDKLRIFHAAAEAGSFTHAGEALRMSQSAVSRQVSSLEKDLGISLFHRHARGLVLTEQGDILYRTAGDVMNRLQTAETLLSDSTTKPAGELRITSSVSLGAVWVTQRIREFLEVYPDIRVELILSDEPADLSMRVADVAITAREPQQSDLIRRPLFSMQVTLSRPPPISGNSVHPSASRNSMLTGSFRSSAIPRPTSSPSTSSRRSAARDASRAFPSSAPPPFWRSSTAFVPGSASA